MGSMTQPKLNSYFGFKEIITNMAEDRLESVGSIEDALALTSNDLSASTTLTHNVPLRNNVQKCWRTTRYTKWIKCCSVALKKGEEKKNG